MRYINIILQLFGYRLYACKSNGAKLLDDRIKLIKALKSMTYTDGGKIRVGIHGDEEVPDEVYEALNQNFKLK